MREAAKINVDTVKYTEKDEDWCRAFLYPDLRPAYMLKDNPQNIKHALELCAKVRRATLDEMAGKNLHGIAIDDNISTALDEVFAAQTKLHKTVFSSDQFKQQAARVHRKPVAPDAEYYQKFGMTATIRNLARNATAKLKGIFK